MSSRELTAAQCRVAASAAELRFETTEEVGPLSGVASQERAIAALKFGLEVRRPRFHVVVVGAPGTGRTFCARSMAQQIARARPTPDDLLLLPNPARPSEPRALYLPAGEGRAFVDAMEALFAKIVEGVRNATEGERFKQAQGRVHRRVTREENALEAKLKTAAAELGLDLTRVADEIQLASAVEGQEPSKEALEAIASAVEEFEHATIDLQEEAEAELRAEVKTQLSESVGASFGPHKKGFSRPEIASFLEELEVAVARKLRLLVDEPHGEEGPSVPRGFVVPTLLTENKAGTGAPVVELPYPTLASLFGRSYSPPDEGFPPEPGFAVAGAIHEANGGFLILPATALLKNEQLYEHLKACLLAGRFLVPEQNPSYYRGSAQELLFPPVPLDVKVILVASSGLFQDLHEADPEFIQLFKVQARFEPTLSRSEAATTYPAFIAGLVQGRGMLPLTRDAVAELVFWGGRQAESQTKVTARLGLLAEIITEASYLAQRRDLTKIDADMILLALAEQRKRGSHFRDQIHDLLQRGTIRIETTGKSMGQVNAISVLSDGPIAFGRPCRVTAVVYPGLEGPVNIAREVEMSGPIHAKGVLVLAGYLASRFAQTRPLSFSASLVFEQTYEAIDGDSASSSELYALLSALSGVPLRQDLAVTGSVDQRGNVQSVGGLNEKIESFFDVCVAKGGLTGTQGVLVPATDVEALMLRSDVCAAIDEGKFHVYAVSTIEDGIELLSGVPAGYVEGQGHVAFAEGTVFSKVEATLKRFYTAVRELGR
jgi:predicted ATP-dependent protease